MYAKRSRHISLLVLLIVIGFVFFQFSGFAYAQEVKPDKPDRLITMAVEYPGIEIAVGENVSMNILFHNKGKSDENVDVRLAQQPEGWNAQIKTYKYIVTALNVASDSDKSLTFEAEPGKDVKPGKYDFRIEAQTPDGQFKMVEPIVVTVREKKEEVKTSKGVALNTTYPVLRGPTDGKFEFSVEVDSKLDQDAVFDLFAQGPEGWDINFKPAYESTYISSLQIKANASKNVSVEVKPPLTSKAGEFPIKMRASSGDAKGEIDLMVVLTGTYGLEAGTPTGLLSLDAKQGKPTNLSIYVKNTGSAPNSNIKFMTFKPENWKVEFSPEQIDVLEPDDIKQVEMTITPYKEALVGDYSVAAQIDGEKASKTLEFRTTVKASAAWGWVGIGIIVVVIGDSQRYFVS